MAGSSSNSMGGWTYDVFLSFRGLDTRKHFLDHLYTALDNTGIYTYKDDQRLLTGEPIAGQLLEGIEESRFAVVVFSKDYAGSSWCLDELAHINDCRKKGQLTAVPVFYNVEPSVVRRQLETSGEAFQEHEKRHEYEKIKRWKDALLEIAGLKGFDVSNTANGHEAECIKKIVQYISNNCRPISNCQGNLVGMNSRVQNLKSVLAAELDVVRFVGIWGIGGAGKTTLAWAVYSEISYQFEGGRCFVENVKELTKQSSGLEKLQEKILSEILMDKSLKVSSLREGIGLMGSRLRRKKVLLVLDDVDDDAQLDALAAHHEWFGKGSRIIITTRDQQFLKRPTPIEEYKASLLNEVDALKLFSLHAFGKDSPPDEYKDDSRRVVRQSGCFPLALKISGRHLYGRTMDVWKCAVKRIEFDALEGEDEVSKMLKLSYDGLDKIDQKILLDIACFFKGEEMDRVTRILDSFEFHAHYGIARLIQRSLITISNSRIQMHDRIQEMGWHIVCKSSDNPGERSRLWLYEDVCQALTTNRGLDAVEGISLGSSDTYGIMFDFKNMKKLRLLVVGWCWNLTGLKFLSNLRWLTWESCKSDLLPEVLWTAKLVGLELPNSQVVQLWGEDEVPKGKKSLDKLRFIDLNWSKRLKRTPDLNLIPNLHTLILEGCYELEEVHPSIGDHEQLVFLSLKGCTKLRSLPASIGMKSLETLVLTNCKALSNFPDIKGNMKRLTELHLGYTAIEELRASIGNLSSLVLLNIGHCSNLTSLPSTICELKCLKTLYAHGCRSITKFPEKLGEIQGLEDLLLDGCSAWVHSILSTLSPHSSRFCLEQPAVLQSFHSIRKLSLSNCNLSNWDIPADLSCFSSLEELNLSGNKFTYLPPGFCQLPQLKILDVSCCFNLDAFKVLPSGITMLNADSTAPLISFPDLSIKYDSLWDICYTPYPLMPGKGAELITCILKSLLQGQLVANHRFSILVLGNNIPEWFGEKIPVDDAYMELPLNWYKDDILGFAISTVPGLNCHYIDIQFDLIEESKQQCFRQTSIQKKYYSGYNTVWVGFISFKFFELLFSEYQPDYWSTFMGTVGVSIFKANGRQCSQVGIRAVYKEDVERVPTTRISEPVQNDHTGQPWLHPYFNKEDMGYHGYPSSLTTAYLKERGSTRAKLVFPLRTSTVDTMDDAWRLETFYIGYNGKWMMKGD